VVSGTPISKVLAVVGGNAFLVVKCFSLGRYSEKIGQLSVRLSRKMGIVFQFALYMLFL